MSFPCNCVFAALCAWALSPLHTQIRFVRNSAGRWHCIWVHAGSIHEFYAPGRSKLPYWRNLVYFGRVRQIGASA